MPAVLDLLLGVVSTFLDFTKSFGGLVAARFFLGIFEGVLLGGMIVNLAVFHQRYLSNPVLFPIA